MSKCTVWSSALQWISTIQFQTRVLASSNIPVLCLRVGKLCQHQCQLSHRHWVDQWALKVAVLRPRLHHYTPTTTNINQLQKAVSYTMAHNITKHLQLGRRHNDLLLQFDTVCQYLQALLLTSKLCKYTGVNYWLTTTTFRLCLISLLFQSHCGLGLDRPPKAEPLGNAAASFEHAGCPSCCSTKYCKK